MPVVCTDGSNSLQRTTGGFLDYNAPYTAMAWVQMRDFANIAGGVIWQIGGGLNFDSLRTYNNGTNNIPMLWVGAGSLLPKTDGSTVLSTGVWYHLAMVRSSVTSLACYLNAVLETTCTTDVTGRSAPTIDLAGTQLNGTLAAHKVWAVALTVPQIEVEMNLLRPAEFGGLSLWLPEWPGAGERTLDYSGNGRNYAEVGTPTDGDPPPVSYGAPVLWVNAPAVVPPPRYSWVPWLGPVLAQ